MLYPTTQNVNLFFLSKAYRAHQVLLNHARQKRKGAVFLSPSSKAQQKEMRPLWLHSRVWIYCTIVYYSMVVHVPMHPVWSPTCKETIIIEVYGYGYHGHDAHGPWHSSFWSWLSATWHDRAVSLNETSMHHISTNLPWAFCCPFFCWWCYSGVVVGMVFPLQKMIWRTCHVGLW